MRISKLSKTKLNRISLNIIILVLIVFSILVLVIKEFIQPSTQAYFCITDQSFFEQYRKPKQTNLYTFIRTNDLPISLVVDSVPVLLKPNSILALTPIQYFQIVEANPVLIYQFNREFYCIKDHDQEVSCVGILFYGNANLPIIELNPLKQKKFDLLHKVFEDELETKDNIQAEMLRMLMARFIIKTTRLLKEKQGLDRVAKSSKVDLLRSFNFLVEQHFRSEHSVSFYAEKLYKSPKTLSNNFAKFHISPLQIIHERIILEAKRLLLYTDKAAKEIAYEVGFEDASHLSRLFKKHTQQSPSSFKKQTKNS